MFFSAAINPCYFNGFLTYIPLFSAADFATFLCASRLIVTPSISQLHAIRRFTVLRQFSAGIVILSEDLRYAQIIRERPGLWWNIAALPRFST